MFGVYSNTFLRLTRPRMELDWNMCERFALVQLGKFCFDLTEINLIVITMSQRKSLSRKQASFCSRL